MTDTYRIAGRLVRIDSLYGDVHELCRDYRASGTADLAVAVSPEDVDRERARADAVYSDGYLETLAVCRQISEAMPLYDTFLFHGSAIEADGLAYIFAAPSGTGKSTHARLWREAFGGRVRMINDDKPFLRVGPDGVTVFGTPWNGKHRLGENVSAPLRAVCILERAAQNAIRPMSPQEAYPRLLGQVYRPAGSAALERTLSLLDGLCGRASLWLLRCNTDPSAARISFGAMRPEP